MTIKISFILPIYNTSSYLERCIESILVNNSEKIEIILVNDGSTDDSLEICLKYEKKYNNIIVVDQENSGLSEARNSGIKKASGDYVLFVDSDDFISSESVPYILNLCNGADVTFLNAVKYYDDGNIITFNENYIETEINNQNKIKVLEHLSNLASFPGSACNKLVKLAMIKENNLYFKKNLYSEDIDWTLKLFMVANSFQYSDEFIYYYYVQERSESITNNISLKNIESLVYIISKWEQYDYSSSDFKRIYSKFLSFEYMIMVYNFRFLNDKESLAVGKQVDYLKKVLLDSKDSKYITMFICIKIFGIRKISEFLNLIRKILR